MLSELYIMYSKECITLHEIFLRKKLSNTKNSHQENKLANMIFVILKFRSATVSCIEVGTKCDISLHLKFLRLISPQVGRWCRWQISGRWAGSTGGGKSLCRKVSQEMSEKVRNYIYYLHNFGSRNLGE